MIYFNGGVNAGETPSLTDDVFMKQVVSLNGKRLPRAAEIPEPPGPPAR